jgi:hypothetical protein
VIDLSSLRTTIMEIGDPEPVLYPTRFTSSSSRSIHNSSASTPHATAAGTARRAARMTNAAPAAVTDAITTAGCMEVAFCITRGVSRLLSTCWMTT